MALLPNNNCHSHQMSDEWVNLCYEFNLNSDSLYYFLSQIDDLELL